MQTGKCNQVCGGPSRALCETHESIKNHREQGHKSVGRAAGFAEGALGPLRGAACPQLRSHGAVATRGGANPHPEALRVTPGVIRGP